MIGDDAVILPHVVIYPHVRIGDRFFAHAHAVVREYCRLGDDVTLQNGAVIGADGFGFASTPKGLVQDSAVRPAVLEDEVEVQANACVDRACDWRDAGGRGAKIDNLVQVGHGSTVGENTLLCAQVGLAGSTEVGRERDPGRAGGRGRALRDRRRRGGDGAERHSERCGGGQGGERVSGDR